MRKPRHDAFVVFRTLSGVEVRTSQDRVQFDRQSQFLEWAAARVEQGVTAMAVYPGSEDLLGGLVGLTVRPKQLVLATDRVLDPGQLLYAWLQGVQSDRLFFVCDGEASRGLRLSSLYWHVRMNSPGGVHKLFDDVRNHKLYDRASFIRRLGLGGLLHFVATLVDPRIFLRRSRPFRAVKRVLGIYRPSAVEERGIEDVMPIWISQLQDKDTNAVSLPGMFPVRIYLSKGDDDVFGIVRATQATARFLFWNWLDAVYGRRGEFFLPDDFFKHPGEAEAFHHHVDHCRF